jgi:hypothetical protein
LGEFEGAAGGGEVAAVLLFVDDAGGGGHPLDVAGVDGAAVAGGVAVVDRALVGDGDGFKATVGMLVDAAGLVGRREVGGAGVVEHEEGVDLSGDAVGRKRLRTGKPSPTQCREPKGVARGPFCMSWL